MQNEVTSKSMDAEIKNCLSLWFRDDHPGDKHKKEDTYVLVGNKFPSLLREVIEFLL